MYDQIQEDTIYMMLYAVVTVMAALASIYLLFRRGNAFAADITTRGIVFTGGSALLDGITELIVESADTVIKELDIIVIICAAFTGISCTVDTRGTAHGIYHESRIIRNGNISGEAAGLCLYFGIPDV